MYLILSYRSGSSRDHGFGKVIKRLKSPAEAERVAQKLSSTVGSGMLSYSTSVIAPKVESSLAESLVNK